jgi:hypothetical protein
MKKAIGFILLQFIALPAIMAQGVPLFEDDVNDNEPPAPIDDYIMAGIIVAVILAILVLRHKLTKANIRKD